ncbi:MAG: hypothetical protein ACJ8OJ_21725 [Povalibacter sp.]|jgi:hypothetical protein
MSVGSALTPALLLLGSISIASASDAVSESCRVTFPEGGPYGNAALKANLPGAGKFVFKPGGPGFVDQDGGLGIKFSWERLIPGRLVVGGHRLDGDAPPARSYMSPSVEDIGAQGTYLVFPTPGCWEITGRVGDATLTFVLLVEKIGEGPSWRFEGLDRGWVQTTG